MSRLHNLVFALCLAGLLCAPLQIALGSKTSIQRHNRSLNSTTLDACKVIDEASSSSSPTYYFGALEYTAAVTRYIASSSQLPACVYVPTNPADLASAIKLVGDRRVEFAISSGRHASNKGFSSTKGVQISLKGFQHVDLSADKSYVDIGSGNIWDNVYAALENSGINIVGGRVTGVGVGGFVTGGGGFSWKTNQHGLTIDTLLQADMILPDGTQTSVTAQSDPDLFFAIKGGGNRFGVIYNFRLKTHSQSSQVYGGLRTYTFDQLDEVVKATNDFSSKNTDPKAQVIPTYNFVLGQPGVSLLAFYDGSEAPKSTFAAFTSGPKAFTDDWKPRSFSDLVRSAPANATAYSRGAFHSVSFEKYSEPLLQQIVNQTKYYGAKSLFHSGSFISYDVEPFVQGYGRTSQGGAWPHEKSPLPLNIYFTWTSPADDEFWQAEMVKSAKLLTSQAKAEGQNLDGLYLYPNYAIAGTSASAIYGEENAARLESLRAKYDPNDVMGLTTFFSFD